MTLEKNEFALLVAIREKGAERVSQRSLSDASGLSLGTVNATVAELKRRGLIDSGYALTGAGLAALEPYKVDNAIIMAAGLSSRFAPISYVKPKGTLSVRGEVLIERQIRQLQEAGIHDITVVVGYKKEYFFYLKDKLGVDIVVNPDYATRNNNSSVWRVRDRLANTYICSSDDYFVENPFEPYVWKAYYAAEYEAGATKEWCMTTGANGRITKVTVGGHDAWVMLGHAYFDREFSRKFVCFLEEDYDKPETAGKLWESIYLDHIADLDMVSRQYPKGVIYEFDSLDELRSFDLDFMRNIDVDVFDNICSVLGCKRDAIHGFTPMKQGITNLSCKFYVHQPDGTDLPYVYRYPGIGTDKMIDRHAEKCALETSVKLGLDDTYIYEDEKKGWKISHFLENARVLDVNDPDELRGAIELARKLHRCGVALERHFDLWKESEKYERLLQEHGSITIPGYWELREKVAKVHDLVSSDGFPIVISHNDLLDTNILVSADGRMRLIDWEYAGMSDIACDFAVFVADCPLDNEKADRALTYCFGREPTLEERRHYWGMVVLAGWCWYVWSLEKEAEGDSVDEWLLIYYQDVVSNIDRVLAWYGER